ncbi:MAG: hypothetical protein F4123_11825 [Gemmatimonadetes bacterium]|nr:hypothetical protein [Gemmatimonadota bacterium]MYB99505.1 hypothetical protein [Gemmatimonadota bacterium]MYI47046.1 hypothetical protein [Gemmatimonadota bacterium]
MQEAKEGGPTKAEREAAWEAGFNDATDAKPPRDWPDPATAGDYNAGRADGRDAIAQEAEAAEDAEADTMVYLRGTFAALEKRFDRLAGGIAEHVHSKAGEAAVDIFEDLCVTFRATVKGIDREEGPEAIVAVRDTLRQVDTITAAQTADMLPPDRDATRAGLARQIGKKRAQLASMGRDLLKVVPPAFLDEAGGDLWTAMESAGSVTDPRAAAWRIVRRELDALVHAWDVL